jgi:hypothetical protein
MCTYLIIISYESILLLRKTYRIVSALKDKYAEMFCALSKKIRVNFNKQKNLRKISFPHWLLDQSKVPRFSQVFFFILYWWKKFKNLKPFF